MVLVEPLSSATSISERPPEFSILLHATAMIFLQLEGIAAPYLGMSVRLNLDAVASPALARTHLGARTICVHVDMTCFGIPATSGIAAPHLSIHV